MHPEEGSGLVSGPAARRRLLLPVRTDTESEMPRGLPDRCRAAFVYRFSFTAVLLQLYFLFQMHDRELAGREQRPILICDVHLVEQDLLAALELF